MSTQKRVGVLTGGGDAPGLNPAIKGLVYRGSELGFSVVGLFDGWRVRTISNGCFDRTLM